MMITINVWKNSVKEVSSKKTGVLNIEKPDTDR